MLQLRNPLRVNKLLTTAFSSCSLILDKENALFFLHAHIIVLCFCLRVFERKKFIRWRDTRACYNVGQMGWTIGKGGGRKLVFIFYSPPPYRSLNV